jgi:bifunctional DNA-binding transcriptional regulator/antitoxin component of YhaV-PrlF toxin-antitoxin module
MAKVTSKYQVTLPKAIADLYNIRPGDHIDWAPAGEAIRVVSRAKPTVSEDPKSRLHWFDLATKRQQQREATRHTRPARNRGWKREDLYELGRSH